MMLDLARFLIGACFLLYAAHSDLKTRTVENWVWTLMGISGFLILGYNIQEKGDVPLNALALLPSILLFIDAVGESELMDKHWSKIGPTLYILAAICFLYVAFLNDYGTFTLQILMIFVMMVMAYVFYYARIFHGGADAKAFMCIAILMPFYPETMLMPLPEMVQPVFPFAFTTLLNGCIILLFMPLYYLLRNLKSGDMDMPYALLGYKSRTDNLPKFVWPMERLENGELVRSVAPKRDLDWDKEIEKLKKLDKKIWVTPKIPFILPLLAGFALTFFLGNLFFVILDLLL